MREAEELESIERQKAKDRQGERNDITEKFPESDKGESRDKIASLTALLFRPHV